MCEVCVCVYAVCVCVYAVCVCVCVCVCVHAVCVCARNRSSNLLEQPPHHALLHKFGALF